jgi:hypothetical protein
VALTPVSTVAAVAAVIFVAMNTFEPKAGVPSLSWERSTACLLAT